MGGGAVLDSETECCGWLWSPPKCSAHFLTLVLRPTPTPTPLADNVGDNVGDIAGMGADLFGSFAESTCAALVVSSVSSLGTDLIWVSMCYPMLITAGGGLRD